jgi:hypothetical protein
MRNYKLTIHSLLTHYMHITHYTLSSLYAHFSSLLTIRSLNAQFPLTIHYTLTKRSLCAHYMLTTHYTLTRTQWVLILFISHTLTIHNALKTMTSEQYILNLFRK